MNLDIGEMYYVEKLENERIERLHANKAALIGLFKKNDDKINFVTDYYPVTSKGENVDFEKNKKLVKNEKIMLIRAIGDVLSYKETKVSPSMQRAHFDLIKTCLDLATSRGYIDCALNSFRILCDEDLVGMYRVPNKKESMLNVVKAMKKIRDDVNGVEDANAECVNEQTQIVEANLISDIAFGLYGKELKESLNGKEIDKIFNPNKKSVELSK